jgi:AAA+ ATPase superfamily predicted ATPase
MRFPRPELEAEFDSALTRTNGGMLFGLRRTGKSSEAVACAKRLRKLGKRVIEEDVQGTTSEAELLSAIFGQLRVQGISDRLLKFISSSSPRTSEKSKSTSRLSRRRSSVRSRIMTKPSS